MSNHAEEIFKGVVRGVRGVHGVLVAPLEWAVGNMRLSRRVEFSDQGAERKIGGIVRLRGERGFQFRHSG